MEAPQALQLHPAKDGGCQLEIEADGNYQLDVSFKVADREIEVCRVYVTCEEATEEGWERVRAPDQAQSAPLGEFDTKAVVQIDRHARSSSLQAWMLDEQNVSRSFVPLVLADDYATKWASPDWETAFGPILSQARFLHDPRPEATHFIPPPGFVEARREIARQVRLTSDQAGLLESAPRQWLAKEPAFRTLVETYLDTYTAWLTADRDIACWVDVIAVCRGKPTGGRCTRADAIILSVASIAPSLALPRPEVLYEAAEGDDPLPCPAASILDPDSVPDLLVMSCKPREDPPVSTEFPSSPSSATRTIGLYSEWDAPSAARKRNHCSLRSTMHSA